MNKDKKKRTWKIWPGKWLIFWASWMSLKRCDFMCLPQVPHHSEQFLRIRRNPEFVTTLFTTAGKQNLDIHNVFMWHKVGLKVCLWSCKDVFFIWLLPGVILDSFQRSCLRSSAGSVISGTSLWWTKLMQGGTCEKRDRRSGCIVVRTTGPPIHCCPDPDLNSVSPRLKASKFSPTSEGVFEPTDEQVEILVETLTVLWSSSSSSRKSSMSDWVAWSASAIKIKTIKFRYRS